MCPIVFKRICRAADSVNTIFQTRPHFPPAKTSSFSAPLRSRWPATPLHSKGRRLCTAAKDSPRRLNRSARLRRFNLPKSHRTGPAEIPPLGGLASCFLPHRSPDACSAARKPGMSLAGCCEQPKGGGLGEAHVNSTRLTNTGGGQLIPAGPCQDRMPPAWRSSSHNGFDVTGTPSGGTIRATRSEGH